MRMRCNGWCRNDGEECDRHACSFSINLLDGRTPVERLPGQTNYPPGDCPQHHGRSGNLLSEMTAQQVRDAGRTLGVAGCFLTARRYDSAFMASPANQQAFRDVIATLSSGTTQACIRNEPMP